MACWATIKDDSILSEIFPDKKVPIRSLVPFIAREEGGPLCYMVQAERLTQEQIRQLAQLIYQVWGFECRGRHEAEEYICSAGLPLNTEHFSCVSSDDYFQLPWGAAMNMAIRHAYETR